MYDVSERIFIVRKRCHPREKTSESGFEDFLDADLDEVRPVFCGGWGSDDDVEAGVKGDAFGDYSRICSLPLVLWSLGLAP